ncbi:MAG: two-component regulator propeller domain-containing protein [Paludibacter sp.]|jgi:signal transduction histidine kinase/ligand-binding sensor domain-containing protein/DNA-binding response OmpR family regulator|nr:two-component regulator propeller domain-containing protein [Paludibacter sp.]
MHRFISIAILFVFSLVNGYSAYFRNYQVENGLSHNSVWSVMQDSEGFMWFGTNDGLNRFDGINFRIYRKSPNDSLTIGHNFIHCIREVSGQRLLIGTRNGVYQYDRVHDNFRQLRLLGPSIDEEVNVNDIMEDLNGNIWVACHGEGLIQLDSSLTFQKQYVHNDRPGSIPLNFVWTIITDHIGNLWLGTAGMGLVHFDPRIGRFTSVNNRDNMNIHNQAIYSIHCDNDNILWIGTSNRGLFKYDHINGNATHYMESTGSIKSIIEYSDNELIMGSDKGLTLLNKTNGSYGIINEDPSNDKVTNNSIFSIALDHEGSLWIGTYFEGINYYSASINNFLYYKTSQKYIVSSMVEDTNGNMLISTHNKNIIYRFNTGNKSIDKAYELEYQNIQSLLRNNDKLYVSIYGRGVYVLSLTSSKILRNININTVDGKSMYKLSNGNIIFALDGGGFAVMEPDGEITRSDKLTRVFIADIIEDSKGTVWFITFSQGVCSLSTDGKWESCSEGTLPGGSLLKMSLNSALLDSNNYLWLGTNDDGLLIYDISERKIIKTFNEQNGFPSNSINTIVNEQNGNVWVSTKKGIVRISSNTHETKLFGYIGKEMQNNSRVSIRSSTNHLYFAGSNGFVALNPEKLLLNEKAPAIVFTGLKIANKEVIPGEKFSPLKQSLNHTREIVLKSHQSNFSLSFAALSYVFPDNNQYAYMLEGFDEDWNYTTDSQAQYMNLPAGRYVFKVRGSNNDGLWNDTETQLVVRIKPPFLLEFYMIILYLLLIAVLIIVAIMRYHKYVEKKNKEKQFKYQVEKDKETYESKIEFFTHIAHEIRTPLSLITAPLESIITSNDGNEQTKKNLQTIERNSGRLLELIKQLLDFRKIESEMMTFNLRYYNVSKIVQKVYDQYLENAKRLNIQMSLSITDKSVLSYVDSEAIYKIVSNLISNALKFTTNTITIELYINDNEQINLSVEDNGSGIRKEEFERIFEPFYQIETTENYNNKGTGIGLSLSKSLAKKLGGNISVQSEFGKGSIFILELPLLHNENELLTIERDDTTEQLHREIPELVEHDIVTSILIVEDNEELRVFMKECLSELYTVLDAENGVHALQILDNNSVDLIISDILMPEMNGLELCEIVKNNAAYSHLPFVLLSAKTDTNTKIEGLKKGADVYIDKPFSIEQLKAQIYSIIENRTNVRKKFIESPLEYFKKNVDNSEHADFIKKLNTFILENMSDEKFSIDNLSSEFAISRTNFQKKIKNITGLTPNDYIKLIRLNKSAELLSTGKYRINEVCFIVGFNTPSYFSKCFFEHFGKLPKDFAQPAAK